MDRTSGIIILACIALTCGWVYYTNTHYSAPLPLPVAAGNSSNAPSTIPAVPTLSAAVPGQIPTNFQIPPGLPTATTQVLENQFIRVTFTSYGGAIQQVELLKHQVDDTHHVILNENQNEPILNLTGWDGEEMLSNYEIVPNQPGASPETAPTISFHRKLANGGDLLRTYQLVGNYEIDLIQTVSNSGTAPLNLPPYRLTVGVSAPIYKFDPPISLSAAWMVKNGDYQTHSVSEFDPSSLFWVFNQRPARQVIESDAVPLNWVASKNQFFATILTPPEDLPSKKAIAEKLDLPMFSETAPVPHGMKTFASFDGLAIPPQGTVTVREELYAGPKAYDQLRTLKEGQDAILDFGWFSPLVKFLLTAMNYVHSGIASWGLHWNLNYGWVVIIVTLMIKGLLWPLQSAANHSMKAMQVLQPRIKELQEKYKEEPQKMQTELMKIYKDYGVNPIGGCLPMVVQIPILIAFYKMLQNAVELRHVSWLWVHDLSQPDTVFSLYGVDLNPLPISMTLTQWMLMKMTPTAQDNQQMKIMQWMPFVFLFMLYKFAAALSLYWTVNNLVTMIQTYRNLRKPLPKLERRKKGRINPFPKK